MRRNEFTVNAQSVQGNTGAEITFRPVTVGERERYLTERSAYGDIAIVQEHVIDWKGIVDDEGHEIPSPKGEPGVIAKLYLFEVTRMCILLFQGPDGETAKNS